MAELTGNVRGRRPLRGQGSRHPARLTTEAGGGWGHAAPGQRARVAPGNQRTAGEERPGGGRGRRWPRGLGLPVGGVLTRHWEGSTGRQQPGGRVHIARNNLTLMSELPLTPTSPISQREAPRAPAPPPPPAAGGDTSACTSTKDRGRKRERGREQAGIGRVPLPRCHYLSSLSPSGQGCWTRPKNVKVAYIRPESRAGEM